MGVAVMTTPDLWEQETGAPAAPEISPHAPLAERMRPRTVAEFSGQEHLLGEGRILRRMIETDSLGAARLWKNHAGTYYSRRDKIALHLLFRNFVRRQRDP